MGFSRNAMRRWTTALIAATASMVGAGAAIAQSGAAAGTTADVRLAEARRHFELGIAHFDRSEWNAALAEFLSSRELVPTKANTKNAAICLRKVGRFDEALELFEALLRDFPDLSPGDRELGRREIAELLASVGTIDVRGAPPGARVSIDGVDRGTAPLGNPVRLSAGSHAVRVVAEGALPFETRVDLAGRESRVIEVTLPAITQAGRLRVTEKDHEDVGVFVDGARVGRTPWDGALAPGVHGVWLRGEGTIGSPPTRVSIDVGRQVALELDAVPLSAELAVSSRPEAAEIFVNDAPVGEGSWRGPLPSGTHRVTVALGGYARQTRIVTLSEGERANVPVVLEPFAPEAHIELELEAGIPLGLLWGGDLEAGCTPPCSSSVPAGFFAQAHAIYRFSTGIGLGIHAGYLRTWTTLTGRAETVTPENASSHQGVAEDRLRLAGLMAGADADYSLGSDWPLTLRATAGALLGAVTDVRRGTFTDGAESYETAFTQYPRASYFYIGPEVRIGYRPNAHFEVSAGVKLLILAALARPAWDASEPVYAGEDARGGVFPEATLTGSVMVFAMPGLALRYAF